MKYTVALGIVLVDLVTPFIPLGAMFLAWVIITKPEWFFRWAKEV